MIVKKFRCKIEEVPIIVEFVINNVEKNINDFNNYASVFTVNYLASIRAKIEVCNEIAKSTPIGKELKATTQQLYDKVDDLQGKLTFLKGYLKLGSGELDIAVKDIGLGRIRTNIFKRNIDGMISNMITVMTVVKRNLPVLKSKGLKQELITKIENQLQEISLLNKKQMELISKRNTLIETNSEKFNDLWISIQPILDTARVIYNNVDKVKLKDYTISQLLKII
ncbi:MAG: hypothetical protein LBS55_02805 [Prevotellaceae bacterium]|nr:hypothetical protein [Prevotellaceae bacterium]